MCLLVISIFSVAKVRILSEINNKMMEKMCLVCHFVILMMNYDGKHNKQAA
jgi:hypothetical protein